MNVTTIGIDLAKNVFHVHGADARGRCVFSVQLSRAKLAAFIANLPPCLIGMEACNGAHYWARRFRSMGHEVRLMNPQFVKPYVKSNKNDRNDAEAICEAVGRPSMRFVAVKTPAQQDRQALHRVRERLVGHRTALVNQTRGLLAEYGIVLGRQVAVLRRRLPEILEDGENELTGDSRTLFAELYEELLELEQRIAPLSERITREANDNELCQRLQALDGVGPIIASAVTASVGDARVFRNGRQFAASFGLVPRQYSTGGKTRLGGISKRGDKYVRKLLIQGATVAVYHAARKQTPRAQWIQGLVKRCGKQKAAVAVANKNARIIWALMARGETYRAQAA